MGRLSDASPPRRHPPTAPLAQLRPSLALPHAGLLSAAFRTDQASMQRCVLCSAPIRSRRVRHWYVILQGGDEGCECVAELGHWPDGHSETPPSCIMRPRTPSGVPILGPVVGLAEAGGRGSPGSWTPGIALVTASMTAFFFLQPRRGTPLATCSGNGEQRGEATGRQPVGERGRPGRLPSSGWEVPPGPARVRHPDAFPSSAVTLLGGHEGYNGPGPRGSLRPARRRVSGPSSIPETTRRGAAALGEHPLPLLRNTLS